MSLAPNITNGMRKPTVLLFSLMLAVSASAQSGQESPTTSTASERQQFQQSLEKLASESSGPCEIPINPNADTKPIENLLFDQATNIALLELNSKNDAQVQATERVTYALKPLEQLSEHINSRWPDDNRFHFQVLDLKPAVLIKYGIRGHESFSVLGFQTSDSGKTGQKWEKVGSDDETGEHDWPPSSIDLYPLKRGPSGNARFLARIFYSGCAGSYGVVYDGREWHPEEFGGLYQVIKQDGSFGLDDAPAGSKPTAKHPFAPIGVLRTEGARITLPFCWFSPIDTWDNPSMCAVDTYDLSGDQVKFVSRAYNRPDLLPIAKAIEHAEHKDYPAVLAYCGSTDVARKLIADIPPSLFAEDLRVTRISDVKQRVQLGFPNSYRFDVEKRNGRWLIVGFQGE